MDKADLAKRIKDRLVMAGTALNHMETIMKYSQENKEFKDAFTMLYISLQNYVYIELFKIFTESFFQVICEFGTYILPES